ncbi:MAG: hypothetical protein R3330_01845 [Saprospiraceae bacterium]|nr:hypothetical protein [Saprospiraceae bacterium]
MERTLKLALLIVVMSTVGIILVKGIKNHCTSQTDRVEPTQQLVSSAMHHQDSQRTCCNSLVG